MRKKSLIYLRLLLAAGMILSYFAGSVQPVKAAANLTIEPITWNVIGLDSNNVNVGPNNFPVGARVCNTGDTTATNLKSDFTFSSSDSYISLRPGTSSDYTADGINLAPGACTDFYYEVSVTRDPAAYGHTREYYISASADGGLYVETPQPRELVVEYLISQSRNSVTQVLLDGNTVDPGETMTLMVGQTYNITLIGSTATNGYQQIESFINFPNTIFQVLSVDTTYSAESSASLIPPYDKLYGDACVWENDPSDPNYLACLETGKAGGNITVTYQVKILQVPSNPLANPQGLSTLIYDFSGSSFHYNSDFSVSTRYAKVVNASLEKAFAPKSINPDGISILTFSINNPGPEAISGLSFSDLLPGDLNIANSAVNYTGCGISPSPGSFTVGETSLAFSGIEVAGYSTCQIEVSITGTAEATHTNTTTNLLIGGEDTGSSGSDSLLVTAKPPAPDTCATPQPLATWTMPTTGQGSGGPPPPYTTIHPDVSSAAASASLTGAGSQSIVTGGVTTNAWQITDVWSSTSSDPGVTSAPYAEFMVDSSNFGGIYLTFQSNLIPPGGWASGANNVIYVYSSTDGINYLYAGEISVSKNKWQAAPGVVNAAATGVSETYFRLAATTRRSGATTASFLLDDVSISGCPRLEPPNFDKQFNDSDIPIGGTTNLVFSIENPNTGSALSGVSFADTLPEGLVVASPNGLVNDCSTPGTVTAVPGTNSITWESGALTANENCTIQVNVEGTVAGEYTNISSSITATETGPNTTSSGYGEDSITVVAPPVIHKAFGADLILTGSSTSLEFNIENPNLTTELTGISFTDTIPPGLDISPASVSACGGTLTTADTNPDTITFTGGALLAGQSCAFSVSVVGTTAGLKENAVTVSSTNGGTGNTAEADLLVKDPVSEITMTKQVSDSSTGPWTPYISVYPGDSVYYRIILENTGDIEQTSVGISDPDLDVSSCTWVDGDDPPNPVTLNGDGTFTLPVAISANEQHIAICETDSATAQLGENVNTAQAYSDQIPLGSPNTPQDSATYTGVDPSLSLLKEISTGAAGPWSPAITGVSAGGDVYYRFTVTNTGNIPLTGISITDPDVDASGCSFTDPLAVSGTTDCVVGPITAETTIGVYTNTASASAEGQAPYDPLPGTTYTSNDSSASYTLDAPDLTVFKNNDTVDQGRTGTAFIWTVLVENDGTQDATFPDGQVILSDPLPASPTYGSPTPGGFVNITNSGNISCAIVTGTLTCSASGGDVTIGSAGKFEVELSVTPAAGGTLVNTAVVDPDNVIEESIENNNTGTDSLAVADLSITKSLTSNADEDATGDVTLGDTLTYTITVTNTGALDLNNVSIVDPMLTPASETCAVVGLAGTCQLVGTYVVTAADVTAGQIDNTATADSDETNSEDASESVPVVGSPELTLTKSITSGDPYASVGDVIAYSFLVENTGNVALAGPVVIDDDQAADESCPAVNTVGNNDANLDPGESLTCTASYTVVQADLDAGSVTNIADASADGTTSATDTQTATATQSPELTLTKTGVIDDTVVSPSGSADAGDTITYNFSVENTGNMTLTNIEVTDPLLPGLSCTIASLAVGATDSCLATGNVYTLLQSDVDAGHRDNTATATSDQGASDQDTEDLTLPRIFDPPFGIKVYDDSGLPLLRWTMVWINDSNTAALDAEVFDPIPAGTTYAGDLVCSEDGADSVTTLCSYNAGANRIEWSGTIYPDPGAANAAEANNEITITFLVNVPDNLLSADNQATLNADLNDNGTIDPDEGEVAVADAQASWARSRLPGIPDTGFAPDVVTGIPAQSIEKRYSDLGAVWLEIPSQGLRSSITGVPVTDGQWDVTWLNNQVGWLEGTAFPSYTGNSLVTAHVYLPTGLPGPFVRLDQLRYDEKIVVHAFGQQYIYQVRSNQLIHPDNSYAIRHEELPWLTLITCKGYNEFRGAYDYRVMVRAVLVDILPELYH